MVTPDRHFAIFGRTKEEEPGRKTTYPPFCVGEGQAAIVFKDGNHFVLPNFGIVEQAIKADPTFINLMELVVHFGPVDRRLALFWEKPPDEQQPTEDISAPRMFRVGDSIYTVNIANGIILAATYLSFLDNPERRN